MTAPGFRLHARFFAFLLLAAATGGIFTSPAKAWWNNQWTVRKKITLDLSTAGGSIADPVGTTVVLVRLHDANFQFSSAKSDGSDLRFVADDDKTLVPYHIEKFDSLLNEAFVWVQVPDIKPGEVRSLWLYYGNSAAPAAEDVRRTYDAQTVLVYHFNEHGQPARDSSPAGNDAANAGAPADGSIIGTGLRLDGHSSLNLPGTPSLSWTDGGAMTWSIWVKAAALASRTVIFSRHQEERSFTIGLDRGIPFVEVKDSDGTHRSPAGNPVPPGQWHHLAVVATGTAITIYLDGQSYAQFPGRLPALATAAVLGVETAAGPMEQAGAGQFSGEVDELEISRIARPPGFIEFAAMNQGGAQAKLLALGADEQRATWLSWLKSGYFGIILDSLTLDGWVVIGLLFIMGFISWSVMVGKAVYLASIGRGNTLFMREWHHLAADLTTLDDGADEKVETMGGRVDLAGQRALHASPIYRIFHIGAGEIRHRLAGNQGNGSKSLSARSLQAIRATLDGALVRETQRLNSQMVLLTIAISGGPFLGLLGTVVGVMITFAAIAAAGDVNVNAIAPGIAAALVATVAGLAVAIPSLFGYNYLLSRVKDATSDMHVFIDEFVAKMAEFYPEPPR